MPPMTKQPTRGRAGACLHVWLPGLVAGVADASQNAAPSAAGGLTKKVIKSVRARARMGHPTPMAFAMQSRHHFWYFRLPVWLSCEHVRYLQGYPPSLLGLFWKNSGVYGCIPGGLNASVQSNFAFVNLFLTFSLLLG